jgi:hypothetical protein
MGYLEIFWSKVDIQGPDDCWPWKRAKNKQGYGQVTINRKMQPAHRVAWEIENQQEMPADLMALHSCNWKPCCNPRHVRPGTGVDNAADHRANGGYPLLDECSYGHAFTPENTYWNEKANQRYCRACLRRNARDTQRRKRAKQKEVA